MAGAPLGNQNARKGKSWADALRAEIAIDDGARLQMAACQLQTKRPRGICLRSRNWLTD